VLSRSTFPSSGKYTAHWTGDNRATWDDLKISIITMNNMALFGIPMIGADICGFQEATTEELCARWIQVGAFSPFSRDHNIRDMPPQELYRWDSVATTSRIVLKLRYMLLPYLYTLMYNAYAYGNTVHNAMWLHFPTDSNTFFQDGQYMWSNGILFTPVLNEGETSVIGYFPYGYWYSLFDNTLIDTVTNNMSNNTGLFITLLTPLLNTNAHIYGGNIIPMQQFGMTTYAVKETPYTLNIALNNNNEAYGNLFIDDGVQLNIQNYITIDYSVSNNKLISKIIHNTYNTNVLLSYINILLPSISVINYDSVCTGILTYLDNNNTILYVKSNIINKDNISNDNYITITFTFNESTNDILLIKSNFIFEWNCISK
jgi:alpha-glucosidase